MTFQAYHPFKGLQAYIQCYLEADCGEEGGKHTLFPNGYSGIFFNFGNAGSLIVKEELSTPRISIYGQIDRHFTITHPPGFYSLGVLFKPSALSKLLRTDMTEFTNTAFDGNLVRSDLEEVYSRLHEASGMSAKIEVLNQFFTKTLLAVTHPVTLTDIALGFLEMQNRTSIEKLAAEVGVSQRYLEIHFKRSVGLSPKTYSLIQRFKRLEEELRLTSSFQWLDMVFAHDYYDQNHFIKDFKRFTGLTPSNYLLENLEVGRSYLVR